jgi:hypothetical protein
MDISNNELTLGEIALIAVDLMVLFAVAMNTALNWHLYFKKDK